MGIIDVLFQTLQYKSLDISNAQNLVSATKTLIQNLRVDGWDNFLEDVIRFPKIFGIDILDLSARFAKGRDRKKRDHVKVEHHYHFDIFNATIDVQLQEIDNRIGLKIQLKLFEHDVQNHLKFQNLSSIAELCQRLIEIEKSQVYPLID